MAVYLLTGALGGGKTIFGVLKLSEYFRKGRVVATNVKINPSHHLFSETISADPKIIQLPSVPKFDDLVDLGYGDLNQDVTKPGCLLLDEAGYWLNARNWQNKGQNQLIEWFLMSRKLCWDIYLVVQDDSQLDKQIRETCISYNIFSRTFFKHLGISVCRAGSNNSNGVRVPVLWRKFWIRKRLYGSYDTQQIYSNNLNSGLSERLGMDMSDQNRITEKCDVIVPARVLTIEIQRKRKMLMFSAVFFLVSIFIFWYTNFYNSKSSSSSSKNSLPPVVKKSDDNVKTSISADNKISKVLRYKQVSCNAQQCYLTDFKGDIYAIDYSDYLKGSFNTSGGLVIIK